MQIRSIDDIRRLEARGLHGVCPHPSPLKILEASAAQWPDATAICYLEDVSQGKERHLSYRDLLAHVRAAGQVFRGLGVVPGHCVAILGSHTPSTQIALWGAQMAGSACPINPMLRPDHIAALLAASKAAVVVAMGVSDEQGFWTDLVPALRAQGVTLPILHCDADQPCPGSDGCLEDLLAEALRHPQTLTPDGTDHALAALYHTGGTTGAPKLVRHSRLNEAHVARSCALSHGYVPEDVVVNGFPLFHVAGAFVYGLSVLSAGATLLVPGRLGMRNRAFVGTFWAQVERRGITVLGAVPTVLSGLLDLPLDAGISSLRVALTGGSPLPPELAQAFEARTGVPVRNILGMTETSGAIALEPVHAPRVPHSCGFPLPFMDIAVLPQGVLDPAPGLPPGETGIVAVRGPNVSAGYTENIRNKGVFLEDGWLLTGDLGHLDEAGRLYITGRSKDVIIRGSHNIDPQSIEDALMAHPEVQSAAAVGMPDSYAGELPVAFVQLSDGAKRSAADLLQFLKARIEEPAALPKRIEPIAEMPLTPIGKIFKPALRRIAITWAITRAAEGKGIGAGSYTLTVAEDLTVTLAADADTAKRLGEALIGMPVTHSIVEEPGA